MRRDGARTYSRSRPRTPVDRMIVSTLSRANRNRSHCLGRYILEPRKTVLRGTDPSQALARSGGSSSRWTDSEPCKTYRNTEDALVGLVDITLGHLDSCDVRKLGRSKDERRVGDGEVSRGDAMTLSRMDGKGERREEEEEEKKRARALVSGRKRDATGHHPRTHSGALRRRSREKIHAKQRKKTLTGADISRSPRRPVPPCPLRSFLPGAQGSRAAVPSLFLLPVSLSGFVPSSPPPMSRRWRPLSPPETILYKPSPRHLLRFTSVHHATDDR